MNRSSETFAKSTEKIMLHHHRRIHQIRQKRTQSIVPKSLSIKITSAAAAAAANCAEKMPCKPAAIAALATNRIQREFESKVAIATQEFSHAQKNRPKTLIFANLSLTLKTVGTASLPSVALPKTLFRECVT